MSERPNPAGQPRGQPETGGSGFSVPTPSKKTLAILAALALVAFLLWRRMQSDESGSDDDETAEMDPEKFAEAVEETDETIEVPVAPDKELDKDEAVIEGLKEQGVLEVVD